MDATPPERRHRLRQGLRIVGGWLFVLLTAVCVFGAPNIENPKLSCGKPAIVVMFVKSAADVPSSRVDDCQHEATSQLFGGIILFALPAAVLLFWKRLRFRLPSRAVRPPRRSSRFGPKPVETTFTSHLDVATATERLRVLGNGGPQGSLRVRFGESGAVDARLVSPSSPRYFGTLTATADGSRLRGATRPSFDDTFRIEFLVTGAIIFAVVGLTLVLSGAPRGEINSGWIPTAALAALLGGLAYGHRRIVNATFPRAVNGLSTSLASALETAPAPVETKPSSVRGAGKIVLVFVVLQFVAVAARFAIVGGLIAGILGTGFFAALAYFTYRASKWSRPRLQGTELQAGFRRLDLTQVNDVRARGALMSLSDGRTRVVVSSALGRPEALRDAELALSSADTPPSQLDAARLFQAVGDAVNRCPLDERTAATLHRPATMPGVSRPAPVVDPSALAPVLIMLGGLTCGFVLFAMWR